MKKTTSERLKELAKIHSETQSQMRDKLGFSKATLSYYWNGQRQPKQNILTHIADVYNVSEPWLMGYDVPMERQQYPIPPVDKAAEYAELMLEISALPEEKQQVVIDLVHMFYTQAQMFEAEKKST